MTSGRGAEEIALAHDRLVAALAFYASPDTYFAIGFFPDPPCGEFMDDFSEHGYEDYPPEDVRPGKRARQALSEWEALVDRD
jgi:hypothetical protein